LGNAGFKWADHRCNFDCAEALRDVLRTVPVEGLDLDQHQALTAVDACLRGLGCGRFPGYQVAQDLAEGRLVRLLQKFEPASLPMNPVYPHSRLLSSRVRAFVAWAFPRLKSRIAAATD